MCIKQAIPQNIVNIIEKDRDGRYLLKSGKINDKYINNKIVDINSSLEISIDHSNLISSISNTYYEKLPENISKKITALTLIMKGRNDVLKKINEVLTSYDYETFKKDKSKYDQYINSLQTLAQTLYQIEKLDYRIEDEALKYENSEDRYDGVYKAANLVLNDLKNEVTKFTTENGVYIQFGCWLYTSQPPIPLHIAGFDAIEPKEYYEVERWKFLPTEDQIEKFQEIQKLSKENRDNGLEILKTSLQNQLDVIKTFGYLKLERLIDGINAEIQSLQKQLGASIDPSLLNVINDTKKFIATTQIFIKDIKVRFDYYQTITSIKEANLDSLVKHIKCDIDFLTNKDGLSILQEAKKLSKQIGSIPSAALTTAKNFQQLLDSLSKNYEERFELVMKNADTKITELLYGRKIDIAALEFGEDVYKLALTDVPLSSELDLLTTGYRENGDRLAFKLTVNSAKNKSQNILETREIYLYQVLPHVTTTVGVIFADPLAKTSISTKFQMAPYYNLLFKGLFDQNLKRKSVVYNRMFDGGWGLHVSAPDFNKDDVPEIGLGIVISLLHDYLQTGFAFNVCTGDPYWFIGIRIPIPSYNFTQTSNASK